QKRNDPEAAARCFDSALALAQSLHGKGELEPSAVALVRGQRALFLLKRGRKVQALADLDRALELWPDYADAYALRGELMLAAAQALRWEEDLAAAFYREALDDFN